jgi:hypothetical protein
LIERLLIGGAVGAESSGRAALFPLTAARPSLFHTCALLLSLGAETEPGQLNPKPKKPWMNLLE